MKDLVKRVTPRAVVEKLRSVRDFVATKSFRPRVVTHNYGGISLKVLVADSMSASWYDQDWPELPEIVLLKERKLREGATVFDLGAHQCVVALQLARVVGDTGKVIALDPGARNYEIGMKNRELNGADNLVIHQAAVADTDGTINFSDLINGRVRKSGKSVDCFSVDTLVAKFGKPEVIFLDVEGYEGKVLEGATSALRSDIDWYVEVHAGEGLEDYGGSAAQIADVFRSAGYSLYYQTDPGYREPFQPLTGALPEGRFFLIALAGPSSAAA